MSKPEKLTIRVEFFAEDAPNGSVLVVCSHLSCSGTGDTLAEALRAMCEDVRTLHSAYAQADADDLDGRARAIKRAFERIPPALLGIGDAATERGG